MYLNLYVTKTDGSISYCLEEALKKKLCKVKGSEIIVLDESNWYLEIED